VFSVLRRYALRGELSDRRAGTALGALGELRAVRYPVIVTLDNNLATAARTAGHLAALPT
jgi:hypothetical protein